MSESTLHPKPNQMLRKTLRAYQQENAKLRGAYDDLKAKLQILTNAYSGLMEKFKVVTDERNRFEVSATAHANYVNKLLDKILVLERECGREPGDY